MFRVEIDPCNEGDPAPRDYQLMDDFLNLNLEVRAKFRANGFHDSKEVENINKDTAKLSEEWRRLQTVALETDDIPGLVHIGDPDVYVKRRECRIEDQMTEKGLIDKLYKYILARIASNVSGVFVCCWLLGQ